MLEDVADLFLQSWQIPFYHRPDFRQINAEIVMDNTWRILMICGHGT